MGGGDLNLKKSWHPSTMKNMEKVWKAEQQNDREKKKIAELKKEIEMEKDREDMTKYAMDHGVIEKKKEKKLDWMYKGPNQMVNREDYLLGKPVDKAFEQMAQAEKEADLNRIPKNHVEHECIPPSLRFFSGDEQVDLARKMQEDPLYAIKKKEIETRNQLLKNPVKLKQLKGLLEQQSGKNEKKKEQLRQESSDDDDDGDDDEIKLDMLLAAKYKQLKDNISKKDLLKSMKRLKHKRKKKSKKHHKSESGSDSSDDDTSPERKHRKQNPGKNSSEFSIEREKRNSKKEYHEQHKNRKHTRERKSSKDRNLEYERSKRHKSEYNGKFKWLQYEENKQRDDSRNRYKSEKRHFEEKRHNEAPNARRATFDIKSSNTDYMKFKEEKQGDEKWRSRIKPRLTEVEKEQRRKEMMANALWRDKEREKNVKQYREEEKQEIHSNKSYNQDFIRKQLVDAAKVSTVASRIKANINNIQRSGRAMDTNFAKR